MCTTTKRRHCEASIVSIPFSSGRRRRQQEYHHCGESKWESFNPLLIGEAAPPRLSVLYRLLDVLDGFNPLLIGEAAPPSSIQQPTSRHVCFNPLLIGEAAPPSDTTVITGNPIP